MRFHIPALAAASVIILGSVAGGQQYKVRSMAAPSASIARFRSFHLLPAPRSRDAFRGAARYDPMASNSLANRALREAVSSELVSRGYNDTEWMPDFVVAVYATTSGTLDLSRWLYGYSYWPRWWETTYPNESFTSYAEGTVIVDVIDPETLELLWRGTTVAAMHADPRENAEEVLRAATAIVDRLPRAKPIVVAGKAS